MITLVKNSNTTLLVPKLLGYIGFFIMASFIIYALIFGDLFAEGSMLTTMPWGLVSLVDIYLGLIIFCSWVLWRETHLVSALIWVTTIFVLGNVISCLYILKSAYDAEGSVIRFCLGKERSERMRVL